MFFFSEAIKVSFFFSTLMASLRMIPKIVKYNQHFYHNVVRMCLIWNQKGFFIQKE